MIDVDPDMNNRYSGTPPLALSPIADGFSGMLHGGTSTDRSFGFDELGMFGRIDILDFGGGAANKSMPRRVEAEPPTTPPARGSIAFLSAHPVRSSPVLTVDGKPVVRGLASVARLSPSFALAIPAPVPAPSGHVCPRETPADGPDAMDSRSAGPALAAWKAAKSSSPVSLRIDANILGVVARLPQLSASEYLTLRQRLGALAAEFGLNLGEVTLNGVALPQASLTPKGVRHGASTR